MEGTYPLSLAILDFIPNLAFLLGAYFLVELAMLVSSRRCARMLMAGTGLIFLGGFLKATWKLLYITMCIDVKLLSDIQFVLLAPGFLTMLAAVYLFTRGKLIGGGYSLSAAAPALAFWKIPLLGVMTLSSLGAYSILILLSWRNKVRLAATFFLLAAAATIALAGLSSAGQSLAEQWIEEGVNSAGQICFALGSYWFYHRIHLRCMKEFDKYRQAIY